MLQKIDHLGIAVQSVAEAIPFYENVLGLKCERVEEVPGQKVRTAFFCLGQTHLELLEPTAPEANSTASGRASSSQPCPLCSKVS